MPLTTTATKIAQATSGQFVTTASLAKWLKVDRAEVVGAYKVLEDAGYSMTRVYGFEGGIEITGKPRKAA